MPPKRKKGDDDDEQPTPQQRKKNRTEAARNIEVQSPAAGPDKPKQNSMEGLPSSINVERFAEARAFEINAMKDAMKSASSSSTHRAWQTLPRHLRRRAASHDVRRVPARLRQKARAEMDPVRKKALGSSMSKRGKKKQISRTESFLKRQRDKSWLETHIWHAKRMKMENMWGYRLAVHPTEKSFRPSHRASLHGSILHDASYDAIIEIKGPEEILRTILSSICDPQGAGPSAVRFTGGSRVCDTHVYKSGSYPFDLIGPVTVIWKPCDPLPSAKSSPGTLGHKQKIPKGKEKAKIADPPKPSHRRVWIRCHPLTYEDVFSVLQETSSTILDAIRHKLRPDESDVELELADLRGHVNIFEIMGPKSSQVIKGALTPVKEEEREEFKQSWSSLTDLQCPGTVPRGMIIGLKVYDPRLSFPPKNAKPRVNKRTLPNLTPPSGLWPTPTLASCDIWDEGVRRGLCQPHYKKKDIDERRSKHLVPGSKLNPLRQDDRVPVLLIQRSIELGSSFNSDDHSSETRPLHGWTLIVPKGWGMPFFSSLTFTDTRVGGQRERQTQQFEAGCVHFPTDYPFTPGYLQFADEREREERRRWERKPPAKRPNWDKLGTRSPWRPDWEVVLGMKSTKPAEEGLISTQRDSQEQSTHDNDLRPWLLRGPETKSILESISNLFNPSVELAAKVNELRSKRQVPPLAVNATSILRGGMISVKISLPHRGAPEDSAVIYSIPDDEARKWMTLLQKPNDEDSISEIDSVPSADNIIGYITHGNFSLSIGRGQAIGAIPVTHYLNLKMQAQRLRSTVPLVKIRNQDSVVCRVAHLGIIY